MALTLTIGGDDFMPQYKTNSAIIGEVLQHRGNTLTLMLTKKASQDAPQEGEEIIFKDGSRYLFGGYVTRIDPIEVGEGQLFIYRITATDYTYILANKSAQRAYTNQTLKYIVEDLLDEYVDSGYGLTKTGIQTGPTLETIAFDHINLRTSFEKIARETGYEFWISYDKVVNFKPKDYDTAPEQITDTSDNFSDINIQYDTSQVRNSIVVKGGLEETSAYFQQTIVANGVAREWILREKPTAVEYIKLNTVAQDFGEDPNDDEAGNDFMFGKEEKYIREIGTTTVDTDEIEVSYKYEVPVIILLENATSIARMKSLEGGDGLHSYTIVNDQIKSKEEARQRAQKELLEYANPLVNAIFTTTSLLLGSGSIFCPGQALTVDLPSWGIDNDSDRPTQYLIQAVTIEVLQDDATIYYKYTVRFGGRVLDTLAFLENLAIKEEQSVIEEIAIIKGITEPIKIIETIERDPNLKTISEEITVDETISKINQTPPFEYGPAGSPQGVWNEAEWG